jgi:hypothetical protein
VEWQTTRHVFLACCALGIGACGGGSTGTPPILSSIALSPLDLALSPGGTASLTVTGTYSDGSTRTLAASGETFASANTAVAAVSTGGVVTVDAGAPAGVVVNISATDTASGLSTSTANSTLVTVTASSGGAPTPDSASAAAATAQNNAQCTAIQPFYWEIGDATGALAHDSPVQAGDTPVTADERLPIASASKWIYGMYVVQKRGGVANLTAADIRFLTFTSGYTYMGSMTQGATCTPPGNGADSINYCLTLPSATAGELYSSQNPATVGVFDYDSGHEENHAGQFQPEIADLDTSALGDAITSELNVGGVTLRYNQPLLAGGISASANDYTAILRAVLSGQLHMREALGADPVCAWVGAGCNAASSPQFTEHWHYSIAHWVEDDPTRGDGTFSSPGAFGFDPWIDADKHYYGVISRHAASGTGNQNGFASALCARELRTAWRTGVQQ